MKRHDTIRCGAMLVSLVLWLGGCDKTKTLDQAQRQIFGPPPKELVAMAFDPDDADRRREGIIGLSQKDWGLREPYLKGYATLLKSDKNETVRAAAVRALGKAKNRSYADAIIDALFDESSMVRWDAVLALDLPPFVDRQKDSRTMRVLVDASSADKSPDVRAAAAKVLRNYRRPEVVQALTWCLRDSAFVVRWQAHATLVEMAGRDCGMNPADWGAFAKEVPFAPEPAAARPWWDWAGVSVYKPGPSTAPAAIGAPSSTTNPWWDWMGMTTRQQNAPTSQPASSPASQPAGAPASPAKER